MASVVAASAAARAAARVVRPQRAVAACRRPSWSAGERALATGLAARSAVARARAAGNPDEADGQGEWAQPASPEAAYGENAVFPSMLVGSFATRKPQSLAYFTGNSRANDFLQSVNDYAEAAKKLTKYPDITYSPKFLENYVIAPQASVERQFRVKLSASEYETVVGVVKSILSLSPLPPKFAQFAQHFLGESTGKSAAFNDTPLLDDDGIAHSWGTRKNSYVQCKMVEGTGEIFFNGQTLLEAFPGHLSYRLNVIQPLLATETLGKYNIWLDGDVHRGGASSRSEAARLAIAHGLALHRPELLTVLDQRMMNARGFNVDRGFCDCRLKPA
ncbi:MAG: hypothetical protein BJ554DRAFT_2861 [Olpidium bornovanus]|uniref:Uncharacterized protein n=1 Tax=Olpidium bornovanus TaxID=278681 RepID=A0A8H7ZQ75_9FUNG|nr:MAG: hypothetical protein BJ554DRAFT_2861 [Olpidium bornovanus]